MSENLKAIYVSPVVGDTVFVEFGNRSDTSGYRAKVKCLVLRVSNLTALVREVDDLSSYGRVYLSEVKLQCLASFKIGLDGPLEQGIRNLGFSLDY